MFALAEELDLPLAWHMHPGPPGAAFYRHAQDSASSDILYHNAARFLRLEPATPFAPQGAMETLPRMSG
jgi:predicted TIM-barrel fold metal-dependent hydrolase